LQALFWRRAFIDWPIRIVPCAYLLLHYTHVWLEKESPKWCVGLGIYWACCATCYGPAQQGSVLQGQVLRALKIGRSL
jgi:hypothetical protein